MAHAPFDSRKRVCGRGEAVHHACFFLAWQCGHVSSLSTLSLTYAHWFQHASQSPLHSCPVVLLSTNLSPSPPTPMPYHRQGAAPQHSFRLHVHQHKRQSWYVLVPTTTPNQSLPLIHTYRFHSSIPNTFSPRFIITIIIIRRRRARKASHLSHGTSPTACNAGSTKSSTRTQRAW